MRRIMIAGTNSGCGKTTVTCGLLQALINRKNSVSAFKCGPDYIDPMFHSRIIGAKSRNLDGFFTDEDTLKFLLEKNSSDSDISVIEGVMGLYDGVGEAASSYRLAVDTKTPVIAVINCRGMGSGSIGAVMQGFLNYRCPRVIVGFIFNQLSPRLCEGIKKICEELETEYLGYLPKIDECVIESRHLGLLTADEIEDLKEKMRLLANRFEETVELDRIIALSEGAGELSFCAPVIPQINAGRSVRIAVASDRAFCFYYEDNFDLLKKAGCEIIPFSPLEDRALPSGVCGLLIGGGYPELYAQQLSENRTMLEDIQERIFHGLPTVAECGGFMYLHKTLEDTSGRLYPMVGVIDGRAYKTNRLQRFGYIRLKARSDNLICKKGEEFQAHEFHYWDSTSCGDGFTAKKAGGSAEWDCVHSSERLFAGFAHLYFYSKPEIAVNFTLKCLEYDNGQD